MDAYGSGATNASVVNGPSADDCETASTEDDARDRQKPLGLHQTVSRHIGLVATACSIVGVLMLAVAVLTNVNPLTTAKLGDGTTCVEDNVAYARANGLDAYPLPKPHTCVLGIIAAGMPRSGSSAQFEQVKLIVDYLVAKTNQEFIYHSVYWNLHLHVARYEYLRPTPEQKRKILNDSELQKWKRVVARTYAAPHRKYIVVAKTHEYDHALTTMCDATVVLRMTRPADEIAQSVVSAGWATVDKTRDLIKQWTRDDQCWAGLASNSTRVLHHTMEDMMSKDKLRVSLSQVANVVFRSARDHFSQRSGARLVNDHPFSQAQVARLVNKIIGKTFLVEQNKGIPGSRDVINNDAEDSN
jgi:hypothetical protein